MSAYTNTHANGRPCYRYIRKTDKVPPLGTEAGEARVKLFSPSGAATWWIAEFDPEEGTAFGVADLGMGCAELGYFNLDEIAAIRGRLGLHVERDLHFAPVKLSTLTGG